MATIDFNQLAGAGQTATAASKVLLARLESGASPEEVQIAALEARDASTIFTTALRSQNSRIDSLQQITTRFFQS